jgi:hypothetical protein
MPAGLRRAKLRGRSPYRLVPGLPARVGWPARWSTGSSLAHGCDVRRHRWEERLARHRRRGWEPGCCRPGSGPNRNGNRSRQGSNASCSRPTRKGTGSACWYASHPAQATQRIVMRAQKNCISSTASCGSTSGSSSRATTTTVRLEPPTSASGARQAVPAFSSPAARTFCADHGEPPAYHALRLAGNRPRPSWFARLPLL